MSLLTEGMVIAHAQRLIGKMVGRGLVPKAMPADDYTVLWGAMTEEFSAIEAATAAKYAERIADLQAKLDAAAVDAERLLRGARDSIAGWGAYASDYFQQKHGLAKDLAELDAAIDAMRTGEPKP